MRSLVCILLSLASLAAARPLSRKLLGSYKTITLEPWAVPSTASLQSLGPITACVGDTINFYWMAMDPDGQHGVSMLRWGAVDPCDFQGSFAIASPSMGPNKGSYQFRFAGNVTFADPVGDHCSRGNYLQVTVLTEQMAPGICSAPKS